MKKSGLIIVLLSGLINPLLSQHRITINPYFMPKIILTGKDYSSYESIPVTRNKVLRYSAGINLEYMIHKISIGTGLAYSKKGQEYTIGFNEIWTEDDDETYRITTDYLDIPIYLQYKPIDINNKIEIDILVGIYYSKLIHESDNYQQIIPEAIHIPDAGKWFRNHNLGIISGLGINYRLNNKLLFNADLLSEIGFFTIYSEVPQGYIWQLKDSKNKIIGLKFGILYNISRPKP